MGDQCVYNGEAAMVIAIEVASNERIKYLTLKDHGNAEHIVFRDNEEEWDALIRLEDMGRIQQHDDDGDGGADDAVSEDMEGGMEMDAPEGPGDALAMSFVEVHAAGD